MRKIVRLLHVGKERYFRVFLPSVKYSRQMTMTTIERFTLHSPNSNWELNKWKIWSPILKSKNTSISGCCWNFVEHRTQKKLFFQPALTYHYSNSHHIQSWGAKKNEWCESKTEITILHFFPLVSNLLSPLARSAQAIISSTKPSKYLKISSIKLHFLPNWSNRLSREVISAHEKQSKVKPIKYLNIN